MSHPAEHPGLAADVAVFTFVDNEMQVLLVRRRYQPYQSYWALPGGLLRPGETLEQAAVRELADETGVTDVYIEQLATFSDVDRDPRGRVVSCCYLALVDAARVSWRRAPSRAKPCGGRSTPCSTKSPPARRCWRSITT